MQRLKYLDDYSIFRENMVKAQHEYLFLWVETFTCPICGSTGCVKHSMTFSDGTKKEECNDCFIFDREAKAAGFVDLPDAFVLKKVKTKKTVKEDASTGKEMPMQMVYQIALPSS